MDKREIIDVRSEFFGPSCPVFFKHDPLHVAYARGTYMFDGDGKRYIDCINNVSHLGHSHPRIARVAFEQLQRLNTNSRYLYDCMAGYLLNLRSTLPNPLSVVFLTNSGSEATDLALTLARTHTGSMETITLEHAYHGHVTSAYEVSPYKWAVKHPSSKPAYVHVAKVPDSYRGAYRDDGGHGGPEQLAELYAADVAAICRRIEDAEDAGGGGGGSGEQEVEQKRKKKNRVACFIAESLQSCGGQIVYPPGYLAKVYEVVRRCGGVCIADEVQVGFGRVGGGDRWWGFETQGVVPDIVTMGKPMGNGFPMSAVVTTPEIARSHEARGVELFNTFGGSPLACAIGNEVLNVIREERLRESAAVVGEYLLRQARRLQAKHAAVVGDVRGLGLFAGIDLTKDSTTREPLDESLCKAVLNECKDKGVILSLDGPHNNVLKFKPPMTFSADDVDQVMAVIDEALERHCHSTG